jgi:SH3-like domain-containing protein
MCFKFFFILSWLILFPLEAKEQMSMPQLPLPRFVSLRATSAKIHVGPGPNYPVNWLFLRQGMPLEVIAEFDIWRQIRDWQGTEGWIHKSMLSGKRYFWTLDKTQELKDAPDDKSKTIAFVAKEVVGKILECQAKWCKVSIKSSTGETKNKSFKGWISRQALWGTYPHETKF